MSGNRHDEHFRLIVISSPDGFDHEIKAMHQMFEAGLEYFHLRKPNFSTKKLRRYLDQIETRFHDRIILHTHHELTVPYKLRGIHLTQKHRKKEKWKTWLLIRYIRFRQPEVEVTIGCHTIGELKDDNPEYSYVFLSPVFDSISKVGYKSTFSEDSLRKALAKTSSKVIALGGVDEEKVLVAREWGFYGAAILGSLWKDKNPVEKFKRIKALCDQNGTM